MASASIFISCVSDEFAHYRDAILKDLTRPNLHTKIQEDFFASGGPTLEKLDDYIKNCDAVIHIAGDMTGSLANEPSLHYIIKTYPDFVNRFPIMQQVFQKENKLSYTQWEAYLAAYHGKRIFVATPSEKAERSKHYNKDDQQTASQRAHLDNLKKLGYYAEITFSTEDELVKELYKSRLGDLLYSIPKIKPINLPYKSIGSSFKGREDVMKELYEMFSEGSNGSDAIALHGLGGMGKTRLAVEYALKHKDHYTALLFVTADSTELLKTNIANLSDQQILNLPEREQKEEDIKYGAVINWLNQYSGWLLILDNVDTPEMAKKAEDIFVQLQRGHILITTRVDKWSLQVKPKLLGLLARDDARDFLFETTDSKRAKTKNDSELAEEIASDLGYLALALEQARAYIVAKELSFERYRRKWEESRADVLSWFDEQRMNYPRSVAITWQATFNQLSAGATTLLNRLAWLAPDPIPKTVLDVEWDDTENIDAQTAWEELKQYSLVNSTENKEAFTIHKLIQEVTRGRMDDTLKKSTLSEAINWIQNAFIGDPKNPFNWPYLEPLIPHALSVADHSQKQKTDFFISKLINDVALVFLNKAEYKTAEPLIRRALEIDEQSFGPNHPKVAIRLNNLAQLLQATNRLQEAESLMKRTLEIDEKNFGPDHPEIASDLSNLATLLYETNRLQEAEPLMRKALEIDEKNLGPDHPFVAIRLNNLAQLLQDTNRSEEAELLMREALEIDEKNFGSEHPYVARDLNNLALLLKHTNRLQEVEPLMRKVLQIDEKILGPKHIEVGIDLNNLAILLQDTNRLQEAEPLLKRALLIWVANLGPDHPKTRTSLINYIILLKEKGLPDQEIQTHISLLLSAE